MPAHNYSTVHLHAQTLCPRHCSRGQVHIFTWLPTVWSCHCQYGEPLDANLFQDWMSGWNENHIQLWGVGQLRKPKAENLKPHGHWDDSNWITVLQNIKQGICDNWQLFDASAWYLVHVSTGALPTWSWDRERQGVHVRLSCIVIVNSMVFNHRVYSRIHVDSAVIDRWHIT